MIGPIDRVNQIAEILGVTPTDEQRSQLMDVVHAIFEDGVTNVDEDED